MPKKVLGEEVGRIHKVDTKFTFGDFVVGAIIVFVILSILSA